MTFAIDSDEPASPAVDEQYDALIHFFVWLGKFLGMNDDRAVVGLKSARCDSASGLGGKCVGFLVFCVENLKWKT